MREITKKKPRKIPMMSVTKLRHHRDQNCECARACVCVCVCVCVARVTKPYARDGGMHESVPFEPVSVEAVVRLVRSNRL